MHKPININETKEGKVILPLSIEAFRKQLGLRTDRDGGMRGEVFPEDDFIVPNSMELSEANQIQIVAGFGTPHFPFLVKTFKSQPYDSYAVLFSLESTRTLEAEEKREEAING